MIESGSLTPGVSVAEFGLPPGTAMRYEQPDPALRPFFPTYAVFDSDSEVAGPAEEWQLPAWAQIWIVLTDEPISVRVGNRRYDRLGSAVLYGVTSRAMPTRSNGGVTVMIDVSPLGWTRLIGTSAEALRDRITPLDQVLPPDRVGELVARLHRCDRARDVKGVLDAFLLEQLPPARRDEPAVARLTALLADRGTVDLAQAAARAGISPTSLRRLSKRYFGFPPKLLLMRTRFIRSMLGLLVDGADGSAPVPLPPGYHDASHLNRDARRFLGMTPRQFLAIPTPYVRAALRARRAVLLRARAAENRSVATPSG